MSRHSTKGRVLDFVVYIGIALGVLAVGLVYAEYSFRSGRTPQLPLRWIGLAGETAAVFGYVARAMRPYWRRGRFWTGFLAFFVAHLAICVPLLLKVEQFGLLWFVFIGCAEWLALAYLLAILLREDVGADPGRCRKAS